MSNLDDKLREILENDFKIVSSGRPHIRDGRAVKVTADEKIAEIKQILADEGYINTKNVSLEGFTIKNLMTGQEWYDRFEKEANNIPDNTEISTAHGADGLPTARQLALKVAKKASGIK